jgi:FkbM family methyltransferase
MPSVDSWRAASPNTSKAGKSAYPFVLRFRGMLENVIPRLLGWVPTSLRRALIGHPDNPSRLANIVHNLLNRVTLTESHVFDCQGVLEGYRMSIDWSRYRSFIYGTWEPKVIRVVTDTVKTGMTVIDIGAHIGYYSLLFAKCVGPSGRVFAFEPLPGNFALLQKNVQLNSLQNVRVLNQAVFSSTQEITITAPDDQPNPGSGSMHNEAGHEYFRVEAISMDAFCEKLALRPDVLKLDVEGSEYDVLIGAKETISKYRPNLLIELHHFDGDLAAIPVPELLIGWGYQIEWVERWHLISYILARPAPN